MKPFDIKKIIQFRHELHQYPEVSGNEVKTQQKIESFIKETEKFDKVYKTGKTGIVFEFLGKPNKPVILFRAELDGLPITEKNDVSYVSNYCGVSHTCGHDGHMSILCALAEKLKNNCDSTILLLFQPEEETGTGAQKVLESEVFNKIPKPDIVFSFHNIPKHPLNRILIKDGCFAMGSCGIKVDFSGKTSHAAFPERGNSPAKIISKLILKLEEMRSNDGFCTVVHSFIGKEAFGTTPGDGCVMATFRAEKKELIEQNINSIKEWLKTTCSDAKMEYEFKLVEPFPPLINGVKSVEIIKKACERVGIEIETLNEPFRWSEDFSRFTEGFEGAMFGIGSGVNCPELHNPDYNFPDEVIDPVSSLLVEIINIVSGGKYI